MLVEWVSFHLLLMAFLVFHEPTVQCPSCLTMVHRFHLSVSACYTPDDISSTCLGYLYTRRKRMIAMAVVTAVEAVMSKHVYSFDNIWRKQCDGGAIGNLLTGEVAKAVMAWWTTQFNNLSSTASREPILMKNKRKILFQNLWLLKRTLCTVEILKKTQGY